MFELYLNGTLSCTADMDVVFDDAYQNALVLGAHYRGDNPNEDMFVGTIKDAKVYDSALPAPLLAAIAAPSTIQVPVPDAIASGFGSKSTVHKVVRAP